MEIHATMVAHGLIHRHQHILVCRLGPIIHGLSRNEIMWLCSTNFSPLGPWREPPLAGAEPPLAGAEPPLAGAAVPGLVSRAASIMCWPGPSARTLACNLRKQLAETRLNGEGHLHGADTVQKRAALGQHFGGNGRHLGRTRGTWATLQQHLGGT